MPQVYFCLNVSYVNINLFDTYLTCFAKFYLWNSSFFNNLSTIAFRLDFKKNKIKIGGGGCWVINMTRICKLGRSYLYFNTRWHYFCRLQLSFHGYCEIILSMLVESQHTTGSWECNFFGSVIRKILINIFQMTIYRFLGMYIRGQGLSTKATNIDLPWTMMISQYGQIFWEIKRKNVFWLCFLFEWSRVESGLALKAVTRMVLYAISIQ